MLSTVDMILQRGFDCGDATSIPNKTCIFVPVAPSPYRRTSDDDHCSSTQSSKSKQETLFERNKARLEEEKEIISKEKRRTTGAFK